VSGLNLLSRPRFDLSEFWTNAGIGADFDGEGSVSATVRAIEGARNPDELMEMLEGGMEILPEPSATGPGRMRWAALFLAVVLAAAATVYALDSSWLSGAQTSSPAAPPGEASSPVPGPPPQK
jgi:hypothetical protein